MVKERAGHTLQPTALINEAYVRLIGERGMAWQSRAHFVGVAAQLMRFILVDHARKKGSAKRGAGARRVTLDEQHAIADASAIDAVALDAALTKLSAMDERKGRLAELRLIGGLSVEESAEVLAISEATVAREWRVARAFLQRELE
jgi:RNA polymerase sigma factor (TIGR02999 family)